MNLNRRLVALLAVVAIVLLAGGLYMRVRRPQEGHGRWTLRQEWLPQMTFTGEEVARTRRLFGSGMDLEIRPGGLESDPIRLVSTGVDQFGVAGAERVLQANERGTSLVVIGVVNQRSPTVFLTLTSSGITQPRDFEGRTVGVLTGSNTEVVYRAMVARLGLDRSRIRDLEISYDIPAFVRGVFHVLPAFAYDEPLTLRRQGVSFSTIDPSAHGVRAIGNVYFTTRRMLDEHPDIVRRFISGVLRGWTYAFDHPDESVALLRRLDANLDLAKERESLLLARPYFTPPGRKLLEIRREDWEEEVRLLRSFNYLQREPDLRRSLAPEFVAEAHAAMR